MTPILFALISYLGWGTADIFGTITTRKFGAYTATFYVFFLGLLISLFYIPFALGDLKGFTPLIFSFNLFLGIILLTSVLTFFEALKIGNASIVGTIAASFSALVVIFSILFLKEKITFQQIAGIVVILMGVVLTILDFKEIKNKKTKFDKSIFLALTTMLLWGIYFTFIKIPINHIGWFWGSFISYLPFPLLFIFAKNKGGIKMPDLKGFLPIFGNAFLGTIANYSFNFAIKSGLTTIVAPIAGSYPTFFVILAFLIFKEPLKKQQIFGILITLAGIVFLGIVSR